MLIKIHHSQLLLAFNHQDKQISLASSSAAFNSFCLVWEGPWNQRQTPDSLTGSSHKCLCAFLPERIRGKTHINQYMYASLQTFALWWKWHNACAYNYDEYWTLLNSIVSSTFVRQTKYARNESSQQQQVGKIRCVDEHNSIRSTLLLLNNGLIRGWRSSD